MHGIYDNVRVIRSYSLEVCGKGQIYGRSVELVRVLSDIGIRYAADMREDGESKFVFTSVRFGVGVDGGAEKV